MPRVIWDNVGDRLYETGVDRGVLYVQTEGAYPKGVAWNGLSKVSESPSGAEATPLYANNRKYLSLYSAEDFAGTIEAYTYPDEFAECDGSAELVKGVSLGQQGRKPFGFAYRTIVGNDTQLNKYGYKIHLVYGAIASPSEKEHSTINDSPEAMTMAWDFTTTPVSVTDFEPTAHVIIDSTKIDAEKLKALEDVLYGTESAEAKLPLPDEIAKLVGQEVVSG